MAWEPKDAARVLRRTHPMAYTIGHDRDFWYFRCPVCEEWSPCNVIIVCNAVDPEGAETREQFVERIKRERTAGEPDLMHEPSSSHTV